MAPRARPAGSGFGIRVDGRDPGVNFSSVSDAARDANTLSALGYKSVVVFDRLSGRVVEHVSPDPSLA